MTKQELMANICLSIENNSNIEAEPDDPVIFEDVRSVFNYYNEPWDDGGILLSFNDGTSFEIKIEQKT